MRVLGKQMILVALALALVVVLFAFGKTYTLSSRKEEAMTSAHTDKKMDALDDKEALSLSYQGIQPSTADSLKVLQANAHDIASWQLLSKSSLKAGDPVLSSYSLEQVAIASPTAENWGKAGDYFTLTFQSVKDSLLRNYAIQKAIKSYSNAIGKDSNNIKNYVKLASCYTDGTGEVMKGVLLLRSTEKRDSLDADLNLILGRLAIMSQQFDKAIKRLTKLTKRDPNNTEAWLHLGEAYRALGQKENAIAALKHCRGTLKDPEAIQQIDLIIQQINK